MIKCPNCGSTAQVKLLKVEKLKGDYDTTNESSMISNKGLSGNMFGTGRLLDDLITYVYSSKGCSLLLLGDSAQLPPVGEYESPALLQKELEAYDNIRDEKLKLEIINRLKEKFPNDFRILLRYMSCLVHFKENTPENIAKIIAIDVKNFITTFKLFDIYE